MAIDLEHARQPNALIVGICLDCRPADELYADIGVKRFITKTGRCDTCGSSQVLIPNAMLGAAKIGVKHAKEIVENHYRKKSKMGKRRR